jgi:SIR2-like domain
MSPTGTPISGHVFVVKADVTTIKCDAWLCPTDPDFRVEPWARNALGLKKSRLTGYDWADRRAIAYDPHAAPLIVLGDVGRLPPSTPEEIAAQITELLPVIDQFAEVVISQLGKSRSDQPLRLALPKIGSGKAGLRGATGHTLQPLLKKLNDVAREKHVDFVLCTQNALAWSAAQSARKDQDWTLSPEDHKLAASLAERARAEGLVLFIGAGAGRDVDLPDWRGLLEQLSQPHLRHLTPAERESLPELDLRDYATLIENDIGRPALLSQIQKKMGGKDIPIGLTHALLASLGARQAVTTNYDNLFERACAFDGQPLDQAITVLPYGQVQQDRPWLLKLHGSLHHGKKDIVLSRSDYMRLRHQRGALYGIVQALLVTKHLLFVGYSLKDEDFHELADEIRTALEPTASEPARLGTVLTIEDSAWGGLWGDLLDVVQIGHGPPEVAARRLQIFLDRLAHLATSHYAYLLDSSFEGLLAAEERQLATSLREVEQLVSASTHPTALAVRKALENFGASGHPSEP